MYQTLLQFESIDVVSSSSNIVSRAYLSLDCRCYFNSAISDHSTVLANIWNGWISWLGGSWW